MFEMTLFVFDVKYLKKNDYNDYVKTDMIEEEYQNLSSTKKKY